MKDIKYLVEFIQEELEDAEKYAKKAMHYKDSDKKMSETYATLAEEELRHSEMLHKEAVRLIEAHRAAGHTAPEAMMAVWDWEHEKQIDHKARVKSMLQLYRM